MPSMGLIVSQDRIDAGFEPLGTTMGQIERAGSILDHPEGLDPNTVFLRIMSLTNPQWSCQQLPMSP